MYKMSEEEKKTKLRFILASRWKCMEGPQLTCATATATADDGAAAAAGKEALGQARQFQRRA